MEKLGPHWMDVNENWCLNIFFQNVPRKFKFNEDLTRITCTVHKDLCTCMIICHSALLRKFHTNVVEKIKTHILYVQIFPRKNLPFMNKCGKNTVDPGRPQKKMWRIVDWTPKATNTHS